MPDSKKRKLEKEKQVTINLLKKMYKLLPKSPGWSHAIRDMVANGNWYKTHGVINIEEISDFMLTVDLKGIDIGKLFEGALDFRFFDWAPSLLLKLLKCGATYDSLLQAGRPHPFLQASVIYSTLGSCLHFSGFFLTFHNNVMFFSLVYECFVHRRLALSLNN